MYYSSNGTLVTETSTTSKGSHHHSLEQEVGKDTNKEHTNIPHRNMALHT